MGISKATFERTAPTIIVTLAALWLAYLNYLAWFHPERFQTYMDRWMEHNRQFRAVLNESWYSLLTNKRFFRVMVFMGFVISLFTLALMIVDPVGH